jgi:hypothetical protein
MANGDKKPVKKTKDLVLGTLERTSPIFMSFGGKTTTKSVTKMASGDHSLTKTKVDSRTGKVTKKVKIISAARAARITKRYTRKANRKNKA